MRHRGLMVKRESGNKEVFNCQDVWEKGSGGLQRGQEDVRKT
jgi:hypothetical protein